MKPSSIVVFAPLGSLALVAALACSSDTSTEKQPAAVTENTAPAAADESATTTDVKPATADQDAAESQLLTAGAKAPDFSATTQAGKDIQLSSLAGKPVVLYFYPKDFTSGCTLEAQNFRDTYADFETEGATIIGVSLDSVDSHKKFADKHDLPFVLVSDPDGAIAAKYGVSTEGGYARRVTFVIDKQGVIAKTFPGVTVKDHATEVLAVVRGLPE